MYYAGSEIQSPLKNTRIVLQYKRLGIFLSPKIVFIFTIRYSPIQLISYD